MIANALSGSNTQQQHSSKVIITGKEVKYIEKPEQLQQNELKN